MTTPIQQWLQDPGKIEGLRNALKDNFIKEALEVIMEENSEDSLFLGRGSAYQLQNCSVMESIALDSMRKAGVRQAIRAFKIMSETDPAKVKSFKESLKSLQLPEPYSHLDSNKRPIQPT